MEKTLRKLREPRFYPCHEQVYVEPPQVTRASDGVWTKATRQIAQAMQARGDRTGLARLFAAMDKRAKKLKRAEND